MDRGIQNKVEIAMLKTIWKLLVPVVLNFQEAYTIVAILCTAEETEQLPLEPDLKMLNLLEVFQDTSSLVGLPTGLNSIIASVQEDIAEEYGVSWTISKENNQRGDLETVVKPTDKSQDHQKTQKTKQMMRRTRRVMKMRKMKKKKQIKKV